MGDYNDCRFLESTLLEVPRMSHQVFSFHRVVKYVLVAAILALLTPLAAMAQLCDPSSVCVVNQGGTISQTTLAGNNVGLSLTGSTVTQIGNLQGTNLGSLSLTTGALTSGSLAMGGTFAPGGSFTITENTSSFTGTLFQGTFTSTTTWTLSGYVENPKTHKYSCSPFCVYTLSGTLNGTWENGASYNGATTQLTFMSKTLFNGSLGLDGGQTFVVTPEPASLGLMGTGLIAIGLAVKRRIKNRRTYRSFSRGGPVGAEVC